MIYDTVIRGKFVDLKSITLEDEDVEFSYQIRKEEKNSKTVGQLASCLEEQRNFIKWQIKEQGDYYFVVWNKKGERIGLIGVYDIHDGTGEVGREVNNGSSVEAMEAEVLLDEFYRTVLHLQKITYVIYLSNKKHLNNHKKRGIEMKKIVTRNGVECAFFERPADGKDYANTRKLLDRIGGNQV